jgi:hypothetical protein
MYEMELGTAIVWICCLVLWKVDERLMALAWC